MGCELNKCCCFIELRTGSLIIGYLTLIGTTILSILSIIEVMNMTLFMSNIHTFAPDEQDDLRVSGTIALIIVIAVMIIQILNFIFVILLLVGLHKEKRGHVKAYLVYNGVFIVFSIIMFIIVISMGGSSRYIIRDALNSALGIYFLLVIRSYYLKMIDATRDPQSTVELKL